METLSGDSYQLKEGVLSLSKESSGGAIKIGTEGACVSGILAVILISAANTKDL